MTRYEMKDKIKSSSNTFMKIIIAIAFVILAIYVLGLAVLKYTGDTNKIKQLEQEIKKLNVELNLEKEKSSILDAKYIESQLQLRELTVQVQKEVKKASVYEPIINRAKSFKTSDTGYVDEAFIENIIILSENKKINPYIVFAIIDVESNWDRTAKNKGSGAYGIGQITRGTGDFIHYNLIRSRERYNHESLLNQPMLNAEYIIEYVSYLKNSKYGNYQRALKQYCGGFVKGHETFYETVYRNKIKSAMLAMGLDESKVEEILNE